MVAVAVTTVKAVVGAVVATVVVLAVDVVVAVDVADVLVLSGKLTDTRPSRRSKRSVKSWLLLTTG